MYKFFIGKKGEVAALVTKSKQLERLTRILRTCLDPAVSAAIHVASVQGSKLVITSDSPALATRLRLQAPELVHTIANQLEEFQAIKTLEVKIIPRTRPPKRKKPPARALSENAAQRLRETAESIDNPALQKALRRLASRRK